MNTEVNIFQLEKKENKQSKFFEKAFKEHSIYSKKDLEIKNFIFKLFKNYQMVVSSSKIYYLNNSWHIFVSYHQNCKNSLLKNSGVRNVQKRFQIWQVPKVKNFIRIQIQKVKNFIKNCRIILSKLKHLMRKIKKCMFAFRNFSKIVWNEKRKNKKKQYRILGHSRVKWNWNQWAKIWQFVLRNKKKLERNAIECIRDFFQKKLEINIIKRIRETFQKKLEINIINRVRGSFRKKLEINAIKHIKSAFRKKSTAIMAKLFFKSLIAFSKKKIKILLILQCLKSNVKQVIDKKIKRPLKKNVSNLRKYIEQDFFKESINTLFTFASSNASAALLGELIIVQLKKLKQHNFFLKFIKGTLKLFRSKIFSKFLGVEIQIKGRLNGRPRARCRTIKIINTKRVQVTNPIIDYSERMAFTTNGTLGIKIWVHTFA